MSGYSTSFLSTTNQPVIPKIFPMDERHQQDFKTDSSEAERLYKLLTLNNHEEEISKNDYDKRANQLSRSSVQVPSNKGKDCQKLIESEYSNRIIVDIPQNAFLAEKRSLLKLQSNNVLSRAVSRCRNITKRSGVHSVIKLEAAGFNYINVNDTARCDACGLEVKEWTKHVDPFSIHAQLSPNCTYVKSLRELDGVPITSPIDLTTTNTNVPTNHSNEHETPCKRQKLELVETSTASLAFVEVDMVKMIRRRTFSHWPHRISPSKSQMIEAGFFSCNVGDRVICLYCNLICQQWKPHTDDPSEVHKILSPNCLFVKNMLVCQELTPISIINQQTSGNGNGQGMTTAFRSSDIVVAAAPNVYHMEIPKRHQSFNSWPQGSLPPVDDLVRAGFYYTGTGTIVTCFYCNGSLQNWGANDNPVVEHARWFPHCAYAKQLCGDELYRKIQESKRVAQERAKAKEPTNNTTDSSPKLQIADESTLSRFVAARLDLPASQRLLTQNFKLSIIKRCWEDQLRVKLDDFVDDCDLLLACTVLDRQISCINGKKENIIVPSVKMRQIRGERESAASTGPSTANDVEMNSAPPANTTELNTRASNHAVAAEPKTSIKPSANTNTQSIQSMTEESANPCVLCMTEERALACIPCGHLATCVPCGHSLKLCPMCRQKIDAFVRVYI